MLKFLTVFLLFFFLQLNCYSQTQTALNQNNQSFLNSYIDNSVNIFFPPSMKDIQLSQTQFHLFWWNFMIIEPKSDGTPQWDKAQLICEKLKQFQAQELHLVFCGGSELAQLQPLLKDWAEDIVLRKPFPKEESERQLYLKKSRQTLSQLAFMSDRKLLEIMQIDPFGSWEDFVDLNKNSFTEKYKKTNGYLLEEKSQRILIPIQFKVPPQMVSTEKFFSSIPWDSSINMVGNHQAAYQNEKTVKDDLNEVSWMGALSLILLILFLIWNKRAIAILLTIPVSLGLLAAAAITVMYYGSIHGLSLSFGSAIAGLALDYALHGAFNSESKQTWVSNAIGLLTTLTGLGTLIFCRIPLIQQMMFFSILGIIFGFGSSYLVCEFLPQYFHLDSLYLKIPKSSRWTTSVILFFILGWVLILKTDFSFDLRRFNYQTPDQKSITDWFYRSEVDKPTYLFSKSFNDTLTNPPPEWTWANKNNASYDGVLHFLPPLDKQKNNIQTWGDGACDFFNKNWSATEKKLYQKFLNKICSISVSLPKLDSSFYSKRKYLQSYVGEEHYLGLLRIPTSDLEKSFKQDFPQSHSIADSLKSFSTILEEDLRWMIPLSLILSLLILALYYKSFKLVFTSVLPFLSGVGCFFLSTLILKDTVDLISVLGLLMVFGFSIDYGVFSTDLYIKNEEALQKMSLNQLENSVFSTLSLAGLTNLVGFFPLVFAKHIVLHQMGYALFFGTLGTYLGAIWGVPFFLKNSSQKQSTIKVNQ